MPYAMLSAVARMTSDQKKRDSLLKELLNLESKKTVPADVALLVHVQVKMQMAMTNPDKDQKLKTLKELVAIDSKDPKVARVIGQAKGQLKKMEALGKPLAMKFKAVDGRKVDLAKMKGKVVLIDFGPLGADLAYARFPVSRRPMTNCTRKALRSSVYPLTVIRRNSRISWPRTTCLAPVLRRKRLEDQFGPRTWHKQHSCDVVGRQEG